MCKDKWEFDVDAEALSLHTSIHPSIHVPCPISLGTSRNDDKMENIPALFYSHVSTTNNNKKTVSIQARKLRRDSSKNKSSDFFFVFFLTNE